MMSIQKFKLIMGSLLLEITLRFAWDATDPSVTDEMKTPPPLTLQVI